MIVSPDSVGRLDFHRELPIVLERGEEMLTRDAGLLLLRPFDDRIGLTERMAAVLEDDRDPRRITHSLLQLLRARVFAILAGYPDQNDHSTLRTDPVFAMITDRTPGDIPLACQATHSRFENQVTAHDLLCLREELVENWLDSFAQPPRALLLDFDGVEDPVHGDQHLSCFNGFSDQHQYFPLIATCAATDQVVIASLRHGTAHVTLGADRDLEFLEQRIRQRWPGTHITLRGDAGFGTPLMYRVCERLELEYTLGLAGNSALNRLSEPLLEQAQQQYEQTNEPQRLFDGFWYQAKSWNHPRWVIVKCEATASGTNRRYVVTNRLGAFRWHQACYDEYVQRGESENRNKELKCDLQMDRLSDHRFRANAFRLYLHVIAYQLIARLRREVSDPPALPSPRRHWRLTHLKRSSRIRTAVAAKISWEKDIRRPGVDC